MTGFPLSDGLSSCSTEAKKASMSMWTIFLLLFMAGRGSAGWRHDKMQWYRVLE
jgi:hypothetical protein